MERQVAPVPGVQHGREREPRRHLAGHAALRVGHGHGLRRAERARAAGRACAVLPERRRAPGRAAHDPRSEPVMALSGERVPRTCAELKELRSRCSSGGWSRSTAWRRRRSRAGWSGRSRWRWTRARIETYRAHRRGDLAALERRQRQRAGRHASAAGPLPVRAPDARRVQRGGRDRRRRSSARPARADGSTGGPPGSCCCATSRRLGRLPRARIGRPVPRARSGRHAAVQGVGRQHGARRRRGGAGARRSCAGSTRTSAGRGDEPGGVHLDAISNVVQERWCTAASSRSSCCSCSSAIRATRSPSRWPSRSPWW
jgi:hypothetical protein